METKFMNAMSNETRYNRSHYSCGVPPADSLHMYRDAVTGDIPWPGALLGLSTLGLYTWDQDQVIFISVSDLINCFKKNLQSCLLYELNYMDLMATRSINQIKLLCMNVSSFVRYFCL